METHEFDVVIIGGGPAGCSCALYTSRANLKTVILDKNPAVGALAITHKVIKSIVVGIAEISWLANGYCL